MVHFVIFSSHLQHVIKGRATFKTKLFRRKPTKGSLRRVRQKTAAQKRAIEHVFTVSIVTWFKNSYICFLEMCMLSVCFFSKTLRTHFTPTILYCILCHSIRSNNWNKVLKKCLSYHVFCSPQFYERENITRVLPHQRYSTKKGGAGRVMLMTLKEAFVEFKVSPSLYLCWYILSYISWIFIQNLKMYVCLQENQDVADNNKI